MTEELIKSEYSHYVIIGCSVLGLVWGGVNAMFVNKVELHADNIKVNTEKPMGENLSKDDQQALELFPWTAQECKERMEEINGYIKDGAITFLKKEYLALTIFCSLFAVIVLCAVDMPWNKDVDQHKFPFTMFAFIIGAATSMLCGYIGMVIATICNYKTTYLCNIS
jgi:K(+)-stimulated pyrophosphate-energized sodium pump